MFSDPLYAISPLDGRYARAVDSLREFMSEYALFRDRIGVEIAYLRALSQQTPLVRRLTDSEDQFLLSILEQFNTNDARRIQELEMETRHDVKAVEYFLRDKLLGTSLEDVIPYLHIGLTSEDINQTAIAFSLLESRDQILLPKRQTVRRAAHPRQDARTARRPHHARQGIRQLLRTNSGAVCSNWKSQIHFQAHRRRRQL
jgi:adenylosuccinate lyase